MSNIIKRNARAILLDGNELILIKRSKPGRDPYWVTVGGGVENQDDSIEAALNREVFEELGGKMDRAELVHLITDELEGGIGVQHIFAARLTSMDLSARTGTEFSKPERGGYEIVRIPFTAEAVGELDLMPPELADFVAGNIDAIVSVLDRPAPHRQAGGPETSSGRRRPGTVA
ncbi:NUDIX hydrolase [Sphaerisporangium sp. NPDC051011]|uniref:NUDIX hydrolase n=1 Tax=Sphaerisporangium sp. NPDC051011 TaxID=3155792 RepID=UPI0033C434F7